MAWISCYHIWFRQDSGRSGTPLSQLWTDFIVDNYRLIELPLSNGYFARLNVDVVAVMIKATNNQEEHL
jgi:hypothetical protein